MAGALHQVLQEQIVGALLGLADLDLHAENLQPHLLADVVVGTGGCGRAGFDRGHASGVPRVL